MSTEQRNDLLHELQKPFHPSDVYWKPGNLNKDQTKALAMAYADLRAYQNRLDEVCGLDWSASYTPWGARIICHVTIAGVTRSSTGEADSREEKSEIAGTAAEAQAFKRACSAFGLGRYLYHLPTMWVEYDAQSRQFTEQAKAKLMGVVALHYRRAMESQAETEVSASTEEDGAETDEQRVPAPDPAVVLLRTQFDRLGQELYGEQWTQICQHNVERITEGQSGDLADLTVAQLNQLITGMKQLKRKRSTQKGEAA
jgi:hypothetical protein